MAGYKSNHSRYRTLAEAVTGMVSFATGQLSIPPLVGAGTLVDAAILVAGLVFALVRSLRRKPAT